MRRIFQQKAKGLLCLFLLFPVISLAQIISVSGVVTDETGESLPGVSISIPGTNQGTVSDIDGNYTIGVSPNGQLAFSYVGYSAQTINVGGRTIINVIMKEDSKLLEEVVVVGYGTMKKTDLTGAVSSIKSDAIQKSVPTSLDQVLQGRVAGVQISPSSGMPGAASAVRVRGSGSINSSNEPIYVVDGVIINQDADNMNSNVLSSINPADIVSIDILKDASATAIYGSRASNGVIMITTKRGRAGEAKISYNGYMGWQQIPTYLDVLDLRQYAEHRNVLAENGLIRRNNNFVRPDLLGKGTDWQRELFQTAPMQNHYLSFSGGNDKTTYNLASGYLSQEGIAQGSGFERWNLTGNFDSQVKPWAKVGMNMAFSNTFQTLTVSDQSLINTALRSTPDVPVRNADGSFSAADEQFMPTNPIAMALLRDNEREQFGLRGNTYLELSAKGLLDGLKYRFEFAFDYNLAQQSQFLPTYYLSQTQRNDVNLSEKSKQFNKYWTYRNILTYDKLFADIHKLTVMVGQEYQQSSWDALTGSRTGFPTNTVSDLNAGDGSTAGNTGYSGKNAILSQFGRVFYSLQDTYMLTATLRHDGTSKFASENRWGWFPSAAFAWRISEYNFLKNNDLINNLKLRVGWGLVGNQFVPSETAWYAVYGTSTTTYGTGLYPGNTPNPNLAWESTASSNVGVDIGLLRNRIEVVFDWYNRKTDDLLFQASLPNYVGTSDLGAPGASSGPWINLGSMQNKGIEVSVNTQNISTKDFNWSTNLIFSRNRNKVLRLDSESAVFYGSTSDNNFGGGNTVTTRIVTGESMGQIFGYQVIGRFEKATDFYRVDEQGNIVRTPVTISQDALLPIGEEGIWIGDYIYNDRNGDGKITELDRTVIGNAEPKFTYGIGNTVTWKNLDLTFFFNGSYGNDVVNYTRRYLSNPYRNISNLFTEALDYAKLELIDANGPNDYRNVKIVGGDPHAPRMSLSTATSDHNFLFSDRFIEDGSFIRLQNVSIGYTLPGKWLKNTGISLLKLYANLQNVYTWTKYSGYDPEVGISGIDNARYPSPRIYTVGLNLTF
ncbi:MAG: TonB-dependent receptor [Dysgonamonadaceae bacterium]|jgi:TonB-linked SusC/RagA family outer membrane protein|nr:TonB-dependent receptor [Dysgonamonadaceae bacterium]